MAYQTTRKEADRLKANVAKSEKKVKARVKSVERGEPSNVDGGLLEELWRDNEKLRAKMMELETTNRNMMDRIFRLERIMLKDKDYE